MTAVPSMHYWSIPIEDYSHSLPIAVQHLSLACGLHAFHAPNVAEERAESENGGGQGAEKAGEKVAGVCSWISTSWRGG